MAKVGVVLSGCGVFDGTEIHEAVLTLLALDRRGAEAVCMAPNVDQAHVVDHLSGQEAAGERRNVLVEAARIARGNIRDIATVQAAELDALMIPGGFGAAKNLCDFAFKGKDCQVHPEVARLVRQMHQAGKPVGRRQPVRTSHGRCQPLCVAALLRRHGVRCRTGGRGRGR